MAAGLSSVSNVFVFQLFASFPSDLITFLAIGATSTGAFISGIVFGGVLLKSILSAIEEAGLIKPSEIQVKKSWVWSITLLVLSVGITFFLSYSYIRNNTSVDVVKISGEISNPYPIDASNHQFKLVKKPQH